MNVKIQCTQSHLYIQYGNEYVPNGLPALWSRTVFSHVLKQQNKADDCSQYSFCAPDLKFFLFCFVLFSQKIPISDATKYI